MWLYLLSVLFAPIFFILLCVAYRKKEGGENWGKVYKAMIVGLIVTISIIAWMSWVLRDLSSHIP